MKSNSMAYLYLLLLGGITSPSSAQSLSQRTCYYPNGQVSHEDHPCDEDAEHSTCCGGPPTGAVCLSNKLCQGIDGLLSRGTCTDPTWTSPDCPSFCASLDEQKVGGWALDHCSNNSGADVNCCHQNSRDCCDSQWSLLTLGSSPPFTWAGWDAATSDGGYTVATPRAASIRDSSTSTTSGAWTTSTTSSTTSNEDSTAAATTSQIRTPTVSGDSQETQSFSSPSAGSSGLSIGAQAGIGVGAAVGALLVALVAYLCWRLHKSHTLLEEALSNNWGPGHTQPPAAYYSSGSTMPMDLVPKPELAGEHRVVEVGLSPPETHAELPGWRA